MTEIIPPSAILAAALRYATSGVAVFPARLYIRGDGRKGVQPIEDWDGVSSTDPEVITTWFTGAWIDAALCIDCGKSGIVGIDQDVTEGKQGLREWAALEPPATWRAHSPTGGAHDYYRADPDHPFTVDNSGAVADGVDVRGMGGFLFAPPSVDPRGGAWRWAEGEPEWADLPMVPEVVIKRMQAAAARRRPKVSAPRALSAPQTDHLFMQASAASFGPGGGYKKESAARALVSARLEEFVSRTTEGSGRSHFLAQNLGVLAGHGVGVFWTYEDALESLMEACETNGFATVNGQSYARDQAERGLAYGMREPWVRIPETPAVGGQQASGAELEVPALDAVDALLGRMLTADQMALKPAPEPLIWDLLDRDTLAGLIGLPGSFKSFVALDLAAHVGSGTPWRGRRVQQGEVVYIVAEGERGMTLRIRAWQKRHGPMPGVRFLPEPVQVRDPMAWQVLIEACRRIQPVMVVVDTQAMVTVGMEENSNNEMGTVIAAFHAIRRATKACVFVVHHTTKAGDSTRGAGAQEGAQDTRLKLERQAPRSSLVVRLKDEKQKDMAEGDDEGIVLQLEPVSLGQDPETGRHLSSLVLVEANAFRTAAGQRDEPEEWETHHGKAQVLLLKVLRDQGGTVGLTKAEARTAVVERFYEGDPKRLAKQTWFTAWTKVMEKVSPDGEPVAVNVSGQRYALDPIAFEGMKALKTDGP